MICGMAMPEGLRENDPFPTPIITPTTKASEGHDEDISKEDILAQGIVSRGGLLNFGEIHPSALSAWTGDGQSETDFGGLPNMRVWKVR